MKKEISAEMAAYLAIQNPKARKNLQVVNSEEMTLPYMLHIDKEPPKAFVPQMPRRAADDEDNTVARVTVADTLVGCLIGYASAYYDFLNEDSSGYVISAIDYRECLKPTLDLVYDAEATNEHWLVSYDRASLKYIPRTIGKIFFSEITWEKEARALTEKKVKKTPIKVRANHSVFWLETHETTLLTKDTVLAPGYYRVTTTKQDLDRSSSFEDSKGFEVEKVSKSTYLSKKKIVAAHLSAENTKIKKPIYLGW